MRKLRSKDFFDPGFHCLVHVRYLYDWVIGVKDSYKKKSNLF